MRKLTMKQS